MIAEPISNPVDGHDVPVPHFGVVLEWEKWVALSEKLTAKNIDFIIEPYIRFKGEVGEQGTMFFLDPENNALEFKSFKNINQLFQKYPELLVQLPLQLEFLNRYNHEIIQLHLLVKHPLPHRK